MTKYDSHKRRRGRRPQGEVLWNAAAITGLLLIGLLLGGVAGVLLDRQGLLGKTPEAPPAAIVAEAPAAVPPARAPTAAPTVDREALEARYHEALRAAPEASAPTARAVPPAPWQRHAVAVAPADGRPMIAIVLDDVGVSRRGAERAIALPGPLTLAFMTYADGLPAMTEAARRAGHELMLHVPMQPLSEAIDPGPNVLSDDLSRAELMQRLTWGLDRFEGYVGINNHMGSRFTASPEGMALVMAELKARGLLFLDSLTAGNSVAGEWAARSGVPYAVRDVFLDNEPGDPAAIHNQLAVLEQTARERGYAIGIGHPHSGTLEALAQWIPAMRARGFQLVPISAVVRHRQRLAALRSTDG
ncbi:MAG: divergent polysaccharide deacetylase family protein [Kiloniellaceae bacterium]